jgi:hypothetical protein
MPVIRRSISGRPLLACLRRAGWLYPRVRVHLPDRLTARLVGDIPSRLRLALLAYRIPTYKRRPTGSRTIVPLSDVATSPRGCHRRPSTPGRPQVSARGRQQQYCNVAIANCVNASQCLTPRRPTSCRARISAVSIALLRGDQVTNSSTTPRGKGCAESYGATTQCGRVSCRSCKVACRYCL